MDWMQTVPHEFTTDAVWNIEAYRLSLFAGDIGWKDVTKLLQDGRTRLAAGRLYDALGSISANLAEGFSRRSGKDKARFYEYALGSARESRTRYFGARHLLGESVVDHRYRLQSSISRLLIVMVPDQRNTGLREEADEYLPAATSDIDLRSFLAMAVPFE